MQLSLVPHVLIERADCLGRAIDRWERGARAGRIGSARRIHELVAPRAPKVRIVLTEVEGSSGTVEIGLKRIRISICKEYDHLYGGLAWRYRCVLDLIESNHQPALGKCSASVLRSAGRRSYDVALKRLLHRHVQRGRRSKTTHRHFIGSVIKVTDEAGHCGGKHYAATTAARRFTAHRSRPVQYQRHDQLRPGLTNSVESLRDGQTVRVCVTQR